jgi:peptidoglycan/LPS O-acetylase OafA/YrhL
MVYARQLGEIAEVSITLAFAGLIVLALQPGWIAQALSGKWIRWIGKLSYGIYVYHVLLWPLFKHAAIAISGLSRGVRYELVFASVRVTVTLAASWVSYRLLELPFLRLKRFFPSCRSVGRNTLAAPQGLRGETSP